MSKYFMVTGAVGLAIVLLAVIYEAFLKPDPAVSGKYIHQMNAEQYLSQQNYTKAMDEIKDALGFAPTDAGLLVMRGVVQTLLGNGEQAEKDFQTAQSSMGSRVDFLLSRSQAWLTAGEFQHTIEDAQEILRENPASAEAYYYLGRANESLQNFTAAISAYETASNLAASQGKTELNASIRISLAMLMQSIPGLQLNSLTTPTP